MNIENSQPIITKKNYAFWIAVVIFVILSTIVKGSHGLVSAIFLSIIPAILVLGSETFGPIGQISTGRIIRGMAWALLIFFAVLTIYGYLTAHFS